MVIKVLDLYNNTKYTNISFLVLYCSRSLLYKVVQLVQNIGADKLLMRRPSITTSKTSKGPSSDKLIGT